MPFSDRHLGPNPAAIQGMLGELGYESIDALIADTVPRSIRNADLPGIDHAVSEHGLVRRLRAIAVKNRTFRSYIGMGYYDTLTPTVIARNVFENPGWYTQYTPYQAEISQGRLEALLNFQTVVIDLTGLPLANASLLDEGTAAAEAMALSLNQAEAGRNVFLVDKGCHPQTIAVVETRARPLAVDVRVVDPQEEPFDTSVFGTLFAYPATDDRPQVSHSTRTRCWGQGHPDFGPFGPNPPDPTGRDGCGHRRREQSTLRSPAGSWGSPRSLLRRTRRS